MERDYIRLIEDLSAAYSERYRGSATLDRRARAVMVDGGNHGVRLNPPFPPRIAEARGAHVTDVDGNRLLDFWQGHFSTILGHGPVVVTEALAGALAAGHGLQHGMTDELTIETAEVVAAAVHAEKLRFTTSGTLATMYAVMLARAFTGHQLVVKAAGAWHGAQPWVLTAVDFHTGPEPWGLESEGLPAHIAREAVIARFNDLEHLAGLFDEHGDEIACLIVEPMTGAGNFMAADPAYLSLARELTERHGALLVHDEVISAFRFCPGDLGALYGIRPDLVTLGKIVGGGMPVAAVAGRADVMALCGREGGSRVMFSGGTYSAHPASMLAAKTMLTYLVEHEAEVYPRLAILGDRLRDAVERGFAVEGVAALCSGAPSAVMAGSSLAALHFPLGDRVAIDRPHVTRDPAFFDTVLKEQVAQLALMIEGVYTLFGSFALSTAHTEEDIEALGAACRAAGRKIRTAR